MENDITAEEYIESFDGRDSFEQLEKAIIAMNDHVMMKKDDGDLVMNFFSNGNGPFIVFAPKEPKDPADAWQAKLITAFYQTISDHSIAVHRTVIEDEGRRMTPAVVTNHLEEYITKTTNKSKLINDTFDNFKRLCEKL